MRDGGTAVPGGTQLGVESAKRFRFSNDACVSKPAAEFCIPEWRIQSPSLESRARQRSGWSGSAGRRAAEAAGNPGGRNRRQGLRGLGPTASAERPPPAVLTLALPAQGAALQMPGAVRAAPRFDLPGTTYPPPCSRAAPLHIGAHGHRGAPYGPLRRRLQHRAWAAVRMNPPGQRDAAPRRHAVRDIGNPFGIHYTRVINQHEGALWPNQA
jgi:hypothetical protein